MPTDIYLVRHAHSEYVPEREETRELSEQGHRDAVTVTNLLIQEHIQVVCSSPYVRAIQTVEGIAAAVGVPVDIDERLRERNLARPGYVVENRIEAMERGFKEPDFAFPGGETHRDVALRGISAIEGILKEHGGKRVAVGTHGGMMTIIMGHYDPQFDVHFIRRLHKPDIYKLTFKDDQYVGAQRIGAFGG